ncbi:hypothetical protein J6590_084597 [Homalodisca vitripennis]|nr:hypothetical protein J6590_084597 [Homalodisca vitripennis]
MSTKDRGILDFPFLKLRTSNYHLSVPRASCLFEEDGSESKVMPNLKGNIIGKPLKTLQYSTSDKWKMPASSNSETMIVPGHRKFSAFEAIGFALNNVWVIPAYKPDFGLWKLTTLQPTEVSPSLENPPPPPT